MVDVRIGFSEGEMQPATAFTAALWFSILKQPLVHMPQAYAKSVEVHQSLQRLESFLLAPRRHAKRYSVSSPPSSVPSHALQDETSRRVGIQVKRASLAWEVEPSSVATHTGGAAAVFMGSSTDLEGLEGEGGALLSHTQSTVEPTHLSPLVASASSFMLRDINLAVGPGEFVCVVGVVGSGKSSLVAACACGDMDALSGSIGVVGRVAYVGQHPWIMDGTIRYAIVWTCVRRF